MRLVKKKSNKTYLTIEGKEYYYYNYYLITDNNKAIQIKASFPKRDNIRLDTVAEYVK